MVRKPPSRSSIGIGLALLTGFLGWTALTFSWAPLVRLDQATLPPPLRLESPTGQIVSAFALLTWPGLLYGALLGVAAWAFRRRLRQLAIALCLVVVLGWGSSALLKFSIRRLRPEQALPVLTSQGYAYPSGHMIAAVASAIAIGAVFAVTRQSVRAKLAWQLGAGLLILAVAVNRWLSGAHFLSDIVAGALLGGLVATVALVAAGVSVPVPQDIVSELVRGRAAAPAPDGPRCAVIYNPTKVTDWVTFRRHVDYELKARGWQRALWLETTEDDPGRVLTSQAVAEKVDLVLGAGGDGTVRVICDGLAGTGIPFGLIPAGTGNLLARNLGIPLDAAEALDVAFDGVDKAVDLVRLAVDDRPPEHFAVMAGIGIDASIMSGTNPDLKRAVGSAAYFLAAARAARHPALNATISVDGAPPLRRRAHVILVGNVGLLQANIQLMPDAKADDGLLNLLVASPRAPRDWVRLTAQVLARQNRSDAQLDRLAGRRVTIQVEPRDHYQLDGDTVGMCTAMTAEIAPGALTLRVPPPVL